MTEEKQGIAPEPREEEQPPEVPVEEQLKNITSERDRLNTELESAKKGLGTAQQTIRQRDTSLRRQQELESEIAGLTDLVKMSIAFSAEGQGRSAEEYDEAAKTRAPALIKKFEETQARRKVEVQRRSQQDESRQKSEDAETRIDKLGLTGADEDYRRIYNLVGEALRDPFKWGWVETEIAKLETKPKEEKKPVETEAEIKERIRREILEERGELKPEGVGPSGGEVSDADFTDKFGKGELPMTKENVERAKKLLK